MIESPLNYTGGKYRLLPQILPHFPNDINRFVDIFCGGCNVGCNVEADNIVFNDNNTAIISLFNVLRDNPKDETLLAIERIIKRNEMQQKADSLKCFLKELTDKPSLIETYDSILWNSMLDEAIVNEDGTIQFKFKGGKEITL